MSTGFQLLCIPWSRFLQYIYISIFGYVYIYIGIIGIPTSTDTSRIFHSSLFSPAVAARGAMLPEPLRIWEATRMGIAAWAVAGAIGYVMFIRPKWYPRIEYEKARPFTPKEIEEWNKGQQQLVSKRS